MKENRWLYFALGVTTVISIGAVTNQIVPLARGGALALTNEGIVFPDGSLQSTAAPRDPRRAFYLTASKHPANAALTACASGFHFASMWEIHSLSTLRYASDTEGGFDVLRRGDSGLGPPTGLDAAGWARTGFDANYDEGQIGTSNCTVWTNGAGTLFRGSTAYISRSWGVDTLQNHAHPWVGAEAVCQWLRSVWCVEDYPGSGSV